MLVTKDVPLRVKAGAVGVQADEYHAQDVVLTGYTGMATVQTSSDVIDALYRDGEVMLDGVETEKGTAVEDLPVHCGLTLAAGAQSALGRMSADGVVELVRGDINAFGLQGRSAEQRVALDLLLDPSVGIVSLGGKAGTGKSALALCAGLEAVLERLQVEGVARAVQTHGASADDPLGAIMASQRDWALEHPHQWALLYGSPVPDYRAPGETTGELNVRSERAHV